MANFRKKYFEDWVADSADEDEFNLEWSYEQDCYTSHATQYIYQIYCDGHKPLQAIIDKQTSELEALRSFAWHTYKALLDLEKFNLIDESGDPTPLLNPNQYAIEAAADWENPSKEQMKNDYEDAN